MRTNYTFNRFLFFCMSATAAFLISCADDDDTFSSSDSADVAAEAGTDAYFSDLDDMSLVAVEDSESPANSGRVASDDRYCEGSFSVDGNSNETSGIITIDFGDGCTDDSGNVRTGKVILTYSGGPANTIGFTVVITLEDYTINSVALEGTRTIERVQASSETAIKHTITLEDGKATWPDGSVVTRESSFSREVLDGEIMLDGSASGQNIRGRSYTMVINETLVYSVSCATSLGIYIPVEGNKTFTTSGREMTIDYGDGTCDRVVTVQTNRITATVEL